MRVLTQLTISAAPLLAAAALAPAQAPIRAIAIKGDQAPGRAFGTTFGGLRSPLINNARQITFIADVIEADGIFREHDTGIWTGLPGELALIAFDGQPAPVEPPGIHYSIAYDALRVNDGNEITFRAVLGGPGVMPGTGTAFLEYIEGALRTLVRAGDAAPGTETDTVFANLQESLDAASIRGTGAVTINARLAGPSVTDDNRFGIWYGLPDDLTLVARNGGSVPHAPGIRFLGLRETVMNEAGQVGFISFLQGDGVTQDNDLAVLFGLPEELQIVVRTGDPVPGLPPGYRFRSFETNAILQLSGEWQYAFTGDWTPTGPFTRNGIWIGSVGSLRLVAAGDQPAPVGVPGWRFAILGNPVLSRRAAVAFSADLLNEADQLTTSLWLNTQNGLSLIAMGGQPAPGTPDGVVFDRVYGNPAINISNRVAFGGYLRGPNVTPENAEGIWLTDARGRPRLIARLGDAIALRPGDSRVIQNLYLLEALGDANRGRPALNDWGQFVFRARFTDASEAILMAAVGAIGDLNGDNLVDNFDVDPFVLAISDPAGYRAAYPLGDILLADINGDGGVDNFDVDPFVELISGS